MKRVEFESIRAFKRMSEGVLRLYPLETDRSGIPDTIGINRSGKSFWIEWKQIPSWPKTTRARPFKDIFQRGQLGFLQSWISWRGNAFVALYVESEDKYYLFLPRVEIKDMNYMEIQNIALSSGKAEVIHYLENL